MSEYWKSTPKYWCKFCKTYVKDTKLEKEQHDATGRHQGNVQRSLRTLHKEKEQEEREKQRAKAEVARVTGVVAGKQANADPSNAYKKLASTNPPPKASAEERKKQMRQLADMGIAVPEEYRAEMALIGDWQTISTKKIQHDEDSKADVTSFGVRKRKHEGEDEEEEEEAKGETVTGTKRKGWGSTIRTHPTEEQVPQGFEALLNFTSSKTDGKPIPEQEVKDARTDIVKSEDLGPAALERTVGTESEAPAPIVFKKRKNKLAKT